VKQFNTRGERLDPSSSLAEIAHKRMDETEVFVAAGELMS